MTARQNAATNEYRQDVLGQQRTNAQTAKENAAATQKLNREKVMLAAIISNGVDPATGTLTPAAQAAVSKLVGVPLTGVSSSDVVSTNNTQARVAEQAAGHKEQAAHNAAMEQQGADRVAISQAKALGYILDDKGKMHLLPGFKRDPKTGNVVKDQRPSNASKGVQARWYAKQRLNGLKAADLFYYGDEKKGIGGIAYDMAFRRLVTGYGLKPKDAGTILNEFYAPGERGRPELGQDLTGHISGRGADASGRAPLPAVTKKNTRNRRPGFTGALPAGVRYGAGATFKYGG